MDLNTAPEVVRSDAVIPLWKLVVVFYFIACGFSWLAWLPLVPGPEGLGVLSTPFSFPVFVCVGTLGPFLACFVAHRWDTGNWHAMRFLPRKPLQWTWLALGPILILFSRVFVFSALISKEGPAAWHWHIGALAGILVPMFSYGLLGGPFFEEFGWRGFLQSRLQRSLPPWIASIVTGTLWAIWHLPLFFNGWEGISFWSFLLASVGLSVVMATAFNASGQAVLVAILMHSAFNAANEVLPAFLDNTSIRQHPSEGLLIALSLILVAVVLTAFTRGRLLRRE
jgi:membrane protease YdiL (CAAX protease family)